MEGKGSVKDFLLSTRLVAKWQISGPGLQLGRQS